mmetsp:Transcript_3376/g.9851  ORF Transcript_3376/g.9851 Transcript_3376/m.9851 type:complete len:256 (+) Transcript_3376:503-1270(+)
MSIINSCISAPVSGDDCTSFIAASGFTCIFVSSAPKAGFAIAAASRGLLWIFCMRSGVIHAPSFSFDSMAERLSRMASCTSGMRSGSACCADGVTVSMLDRFAWAGFVARALAPAPALAPALFAPAAFFFFLPEPPPRKPFLRPPPKPFFMRFSSLAFSAALAFRAASAAATISSMRLGSSSSSSSSLSLSASGLMTLPSSSSSSMTTALPALAPSPITFSMPSRSARPPPPPPSPSTSRGAASGAGGVVIVGPG